jgi:hypothetical protein
MDIVLYYLLLFGALIGSVYFLSRGLKSLSVARHQQDGLPVPKAKALTNIAIGIFGTVLWFTIIIVSIYNQLLSPNK